MNYKDFVKSVADKAYQSGHFQLVDALTTVVFNDDIDTMATNGKNIFVNPKFAAKLTSDETLGVLAHEMLHDAFGHSFVAWGHYDRNSGLSPQSWQHLKNVAMDIVVNDAVKSLGLTLPKGALKREDFNIPQSLDYSHAIFNKLLEDLKRKKETMQKIQEAMNQMAREMQDNESVANQQEQRASSNGYPKGSPQAKQQKQQSQKSPQSQQQDSDDGMGSQGQQSDEGQQQRGNGQQQVGQTGQSGQDNSSDDNQSQQDGGSAGQGDLAKKEKELEDEIKEHQKKVDDLKKKMDEAEAASQSGSDGEGSQDGADGSDDFGNSSDEENKEKDDLKKKKEELEKEKEELEKEAEELEKKKKDLEKQKENANSGASSEPERGTDENNSSSNSKSQSGEGSDNDESEGEDGDGESEDEGDDDFWNSSEGRNILGDDSDDSEDDDNFDDDDSEDGDGESEDDLDSEDSDSSSQAGDSEEDSFQSSDDSQQNSDSQDGSSNSSSNGQGQENSGDSTSERKRDNLAQAMQNLASEVNQKIKEAVFKRQPVTGSSMLNSPAHKRFWVDRVFDHIGRFVQAIKRERTFARPSVRRVSMGLPGSIYKTPAAGMRREDPEPRVVFFVDVSGSMDNKPEDIRKSLLLRAHILNRTKSVIVPFGTYVSKREYSLEDSLVGARRETGGGTNFSNVVAAINEYKGQYDLFVIVTDLKGYIDFDKVERRKHLIVVTDNPEGVRGLPQNAELIAVEGGF